MSGTVWTVQAVMKAIASLPNIDGVVAISFAELSKVTGFTSLQIRNACYELKKRAYIDHRLYSDGKVKPGHYVLTELGKHVIAAGLDKTKFKPGPRTPPTHRKGKQGTLRERAWRLLRIKQSASVNELLATLMDADSTMQSAETNLNRYFVGLLRAGYVVEQKRTSALKKSDKQYFLTRNSGPLAPILKKTSCQVYDQNQGKHYDITA